MNCNPSGCANVRRRGNIGNMPPDAPQVVRCPAELCADALALVLCNLAPSERRGLAKSVCDSVALANDHEPLFIALEQGKLRGAAWGQRQTGNYAVLWPPQLTGGEPAPTAVLLAEAVVRDLDAAGVDLAQSLLANANDELVSVLNRVGFEHAADLLYLTCEAARFPLAAPAPCEIGFAEYAETGRDRLAHLIERTYENSHDCTALDGARSIDDVISGYQATGAFRPQNWLFVRYQNHDVGVLLLADHHPARHWELTYMGLMPQWRGRGWGRQIARYAQWLARGENVERILVAVDAGNQPAVDVYRSTGFEIWDRRAVFLRFPARNRQERSP